MGSSEHQSTQSDSTSSLAAAMTEVGYFSFGSSFGLEMGLSESVSRRSRLSTSIMSSMSNAFPSADSRAASSAFSVVASSSSTCHPILYLVIGGKWPSVASAARLELCSQKNCTSCLLEGFTRP